MRIHRDWHIASLSSLNNDLNAGASEGTYSLCRGVWCVIGKGALPMDSSENKTRSQRDEVDDVLVAFWEWLRLQEGRWRDEPGRKEFHFSPSIAAGDPILDAHRRPATLQRPSVARRVLRTCPWGFLLTAIVSAAVAWQSSDDTTKDLVRRWVNEVAGLGTVVHDE